ncbi:uncharacterized protein LOC116142121 [Pistacia vera]|uniref:uncharacterized protein LOC116142121 n=1 Tax=Pistacia vera TaxID=55513 RepID=UPI0012631CEB|nr:uncharacterized protein LOC116142121 [Pistacia vera]
MAAQSALMSPPVFNGEQYHIWAVKMKAFLRSQGLWQYVEENRQLPPLGPNPTLNQMRLHEEETAKAPKALSHIHAIVADLVFTRIMAYKTLKEAWDKLREECMGSNTTRNMQVKDYVDRLMSVVNKIRLLGVELTDRRVVEKVLVSLPKRFESKISSLEDSRDMRQVTLTKLVHALEAQEQRRLLRQEDIGEGPMMAAHKTKPAQGNNRRYPGEKGKEMSNGQWGKPSGMKEYPPCSHCKRKGHSEKRCWFRLGIQCRACL